MNAIDDVAADAAIMTRVVDGAVVDADYQDGSSPYP
jgi:hypothetical protein